MKRKLTAAGILILLVLSLGIGGCGNKFYDPTQIGRFRPVPAVNVILDSLGVAEETPSAWEGTEEPRPVDTMVFESDYVFSSGDIVRVSIFELLQEDVPFVNDYVVTETGKISIPEVGVVEAGGLTESQFEEQIAQILSPSILKDPSVTVILMSSQKRTFSISGNGVPRPDRYTIPRYEYRLLDALATAGGVNQFNISYVYVTRTVTGKEAISELAEPPLAEPEDFQQIITPESEMLEIIAPRAQRTLSSLSRGLVITSAELITDSELDEVALPEGFESFRDDLQTKLSVEDIQGFEEQFSYRQVIDAPIIDEAEGRIEWIFQDGKWVPVQVGRPELKKPAGRRPESIAERPGKPIPEDFGWEQVGDGGVQTRVIKIPADKLVAGDPRYNITIRPGDNIQVPVDLIGEFWIEGNVNFQGPINITGRPITLKMAIASAGGLGPLAWPKRCEVIRRIGRNKEEIVMVDLDKIASGKQPDFFIKPNDLINVGTHPTARWRAVLRNAFRATYGFGFIYDRNFSDRDFGTSRPFGSLF